MNSRGRELAGDTFPGTVWFKQAVCVFCDHFVCKAVLTTMEELSSIPENFGLVITS